jgi:hypothetical protein
MVSARSVPAALRTERPEPRELVTGLRGRRHGEAAERAHEIERLSLAGLPPGPSLTWPIGGDVVEFRADQVTEG